MIIDSSGNLGIGAFPPVGESIKLLDFTVFEDTDGYTVYGRDDKSVTVKTYEEVEELFRLRFAEWKLERD
jgi:hypothetical protein